jgi:hypothetical protein
MHLIKTKNCSRKTDRYGLRVGIDLFKLTRGLYDEGYKGIEFVGDYRLTKKYFLAAELEMKTKLMMTDSILQQKARI